MISYFTEQFNLNKEKPAIIWNDQVLTYNDLLLLIDKAKLFLNSFLDL